ncbi:GNAT family N-acetyltransferase [Planktothrix sp. FACHB-1355]|uniref:GNAT family N-acetyltransferase n=1 Tax=Aerosakkonema funiforme FACHB-1375 TaxID=2949571 RepID=A0A926VEG8_9CYAN|nr:MULTISPECIES: GNAT family N-acetyltransferase [Oscillatoriales]MBD2182471.1 GNAT family N-acetyltransferase [Aerosakkonema funiforme FACHB-1375]MBD3561456.1 GNAT family N-acetyltransferase [Planktothrix sp. FACHB-1355]
MNFIKLGQATEVEVINAIESNMCGHISYFARHLPAMAVIDTPEMLLIDSKLRSDTFNFVCRVNFPASEVVDRIDFAIDYFQKRNLPVAWWIGANSQPPNLTKRLEKHGIKQVEEAPGMAMDLSEFNQNYTLPPGLEIRRVKNLEEIEDYANIIASCWNPPDFCVIEFYRQAAAIAFRPEIPVQFYIGYLGNEAIATTELFLDAGVAGIYGVVTLAKYRKRGIGTAMTLAALFDAKKQGYQTATLQASEDGKNIYASLGFRQYCNFYVYQ